ncbi:M55 family metallopeptidase [Dethiosulfovibrio salsuginis]|uniref:D-amino peptidase n=1 Tax=Dethiosulfovibrio salsuginis TaxID=561720 RepID=A0A1X7JUG0_9BACT|nr:M55 family metallopeptidase [Dethiosulfovibrio salsuginis]SMG31325.1 D-amino peptidase [Dethiosulfovibrio salsuginis]
MKIYMSVDMEGATGIVRSEQVRNSDVEYGYGRAMQTHDLLAAIEGAFDGGAEEIIVNDAHDRMINLSPESMPGSEGRLRIISGNPKQLGMMEGMRGHPRR